jgi:hypothetical protein
VINVNIDKLLSGDFGAQIRHVNAQQYSSLLRRFFFRRSPVIPSHFDYLKVVKRIFVVAKMMSSFDEMFFVLFSLLAQ